MMLLERRGQLELMARALRLARDGRGAQLLVSGPLGSGRSALLHAVPTEGVLALRAGGAPLEQDHAFGVVRQLFDPVLAGATPETRAEWLTGPAGPVFTDDGYPEDVPEAALQGLTALIHMISDDRPVVLLLDDLQWVDDPSLRWLTRLARRLETLRVLVVATVREGDAGADRPLVTDLRSCSADVVRPAPLSAAAVATLIREHTGTNPAAELVGACHQASGGNPMFVTAMVPELTDADSVPALRPGQLRDRVGHCLRSQTEAVQAFARATAVLGERTDVELIGHFAGLDSIGRTAAMRTLYRLGLLAAPGSPAFTHVVVRDAVEASMAVPEREELAVRAVRLLHDAGHPAEQVAALLLGTTARHDTWAIEVLRSAADVAMRRGSAETAARYLRRALLEASPDGEDRARLLVDLAIAERRFDAASSVRHICYAVPLIRSVRDRAAAVVHIAPTQLVPSAGPVRELIEQIARDLGDPAELTGGDRELALWLEARLRYLPQPGAAHVDDSVRRLREAVEHDLLDTSAGRELILVLLREVMLAVGTPAAEVAKIGGMVLDREPAAATHVHTAVPLAVLSLVAADSLTQVEGWLELALDRARGQQLVVEQALIRAEQALVLAHSGRPEEARDAASEALDLVALDWSGGNLTAAAALAGVALELRDTKLAARLLALWPAGEDHTCENAIRRMVHGLTIERDDERALEYFTESGRLLDRGGWRNPVLFSWRLTAALLGARTGDLDTALALAHEAREQAVAWGAPSGIGRALRTLGRLTPGAEGVELLREAAAVLEDSGHRLEHAKSVLRLATRLRDEGEPAVEVFHQAGELARQAGAAWLIGAAGGVRDNVVTLTKSEERVARMAVAGHTNSEIADLLRVTTRAVEKHLTSCFRKLHIRRRSELSAALALHLPVAGGPV